MKIKDLKAGDKVRCFGSTGAYLVEVENVVVDMTHYRDIAYVIKDNNVKGTLTDNDEWIFYADKVSNKKHKSNDVQQKKRFEHLSVKWKDKNTLETNDGRYVKIPNSVLNDENESIVDYLQSELKSEEHDIVNKPSHYTYGKIEIIDIVEQVTTAYPINIAFSIGNALKYICRAPFKNGVEDLKKAVWYLDRAIKKWEETK